MLSVRTRRIALSTALTVTLAGLLGMAPVLASPARPAAVSPGGARSDQRSRVAAGAVLGTAALSKAARYRVSQYQSQALNWRPCIDRQSDPGLPSDYYRLQCATLTAPLDWADPTGPRQVKIAVSRLPASVKPAKGVLFTNPGGPGGAGLDLPLLFIDDARKRITRSQDVYGIDVRGTGASTNVTCGGASSTLLDPRDRSQANVNLILDEAALTARACSTAGAGLIDYVNTDQTVRDLDLLRTVVKASKINWLGFSAGTWLGAQYATAFPQNVGNMVLDSNVDFTSSWQDAFELQPAGFERRFRSDFLPWVAKYASIYRLGATPTQVEAGYERIRAGMQPDLPIDSAVTLDQLIAGAMYSKGLFPLAASVLEDVDAFLAAQRGSDLHAASVARRRIDAALPQLQLVGMGRQPLASDASDAAFLAVTCNDGPWSGDRSSLIASSAQLGAASPLIGWSTLYEPCLFWNRPPVTTPVPTGVGVPPVLMVQSEHDPATPIEGARHAAATFAGARMLTVTGEGDHGVYAGGNPCVDAVVERFILTGVLPAVGATCKGEPLPDPRAFSAEGLSAAGVEAHKHGEPAAADLGLAAKLPPPGTNPLVALRRIDALISP